jgi:hypothetical protein
MAKNLRYLAISILVSWVLLCTRTLMAQSATVTGNVWFRTFMVKGKEIGTIFSIDIDEREYWITAKHLLTGAKHPPFGTVDAKTATLGILSQNESNKEWNAVSFRVIDPGKDVDIIVLAPETSLLGKNTIETAKVSSAGTMFGGECEFVGFPFGSAWTTKFEKSEMIRMPFVKHCTISGEIRSPQVIWILDGINNEGFSGGPVVVDTGPQQHIIGVISGFQREPIEVVPLPDSASPQSGGANDSSAQRRPKEAALANTGFFFAYDMTCAIEAIKKNPIGPKRN